METLHRQVSVPPDRFEVVPDDVVFTVDLYSALAICIYDAVDEAGALLHLRVITRGVQPTEATDTTLATELLLLDRCVRRCVRSRPTPARCRRKSRPTCPWAHRTSRPAIPS